MLSEVTTENEYIKLISHFCNYTYDPSLSMDKRPLDKGVSALPGGIGLWETGAWPMASVE